MRMNMFIEKVGNAMTRTKEHLAWVKKLWSKAYPVIRTVAQKLSWINPLRYLSILDWYIIRKFIGTYFFAILLIISISIVFDVNENLAKFSQYHAPLKAIVFDYYANFVPYFANLFSPLFVFIAVIFFTSKLAGNSEIIAMLAAGMSFRRLMRPYMISCVLISALTFYLGAYIIPHGTIVRQNFETIYKNNTLSHAVDDNGGEYRFIGNYINTAQREAVSVPVNCYFYGLAKASDTKPAFWFWPYKSHLTWPSYKCTVETVNVELGEQDACDFFNFVAGFSASSKYQSSFFGDDELNSNETTSVDQVVIVAGDDDQAIYNLSGQLVSKNGNLDGLQKGVYVKGGKKFIVK